MLGLESRSGGQDRYERVMLALVVTSFLMVLLLSIGISLQQAEYQPTESLMWLEAKSDPLGAPKDDFDGDGLSNIEENYDYGTNIYDPDTDGDGMDDFWEVRWIDVVDPFTEELLIDPTDPNDAYEDPDNDGYDYNRNGRIDRYDDSVTLTDLGLAPDADYDEKSIKRLIQNPPLYRQSLIRLSGVHVMDNGTFPLGAGQGVDQQITIQVAEESGDTSRDWLRIVIQPNANRPVDLRAYGQTREGQQLIGDRVDVQGYFQEFAGACWIEVRGGEEFTNIMEYRSRFYMGDIEHPIQMRVYNQTDPTVPDTDGDGMNDGWESHYGLRLIDPDTGDVEWVVEIDPTSGLDAYRDPDGDVIDTRWNLVRWLWVDPDGDGVFEPPYGANPFDTVLVGYNIHEYIMNTNPVEADTDNDSYPFGAGTTNDFDEIVYLGTDPNNVDTDGDEMWDGWEIHFKLQPDNASDRFADEDADKLVNYREFIHDTRPDMNDTDSDMMMDGWEVEYGLNPKNPNDANGDLDEDQLDNWQEFLNDTNPRDQDTDRDFLSDYEEVVLDFYVTVDGVITSYHTDPTYCDTDLDDVLDDEDGDGNYDPNEEILDGIDNDGDSAILQNNGIDDDHDGVVDDGRPGIPSVGLPEGVDEEHDLNDYNEIFIYRTNASDPDTDGEGLDDWHEWFTDVHPREPGIQRTSPTLSDTDSDRLDDKQEQDWSWSVDRPYQGSTDPLNPDTDSDGLGDGDEVLEDYDQSTVDKMETCDPLNPDTDSDGMLDGYEFDYSDIDNDGLPTWWERENSGVYKWAEFRRDANLDGIPDLLNDWDGDGVSNIMEYMYRLDPWDPEQGGQAMEARTSTPWPYLRRIPVYSDSDGDLMPDWWEVLMDLDPLKPTDRWEDPDHDLLVNIDEYIFDLDPFDPDTDGDDETDLFDHEIMSSRDSYDQDEDGIADWFERMYSQILDHTDPEDADRHDDDDNWTNYEEYIFASDPYGHAPTDPTKTSTDGDGSADDTDPFPLYFTVTHRPLNPTREVQSLSPITAYDVHGIPEGAGDMDRDGLNNSAEHARDVSHTDPTDPDTDGDGMPDGWEATYAYWDPFTAKPNLSPLDPSDPYEDPDWDGINYSLQRDQYGQYIITEYDINRDGRIDPVLENESFCNLEEYLYGIDLDRDGINDITPDPNDWDTDYDGIIDGWEALLSDNDGDGMSNWYELVYGLNPFDPEGDNGTWGDPDGDGIANIDEFKDLTNPTGPDSGYLGRSAGSGRGGIQRDSSAWKEAWTIDD